MESEKPVAHKSDMVADVEVIMDSVSVAEVAIPVREQLVRDRCELLSPLELEEPDRTEGEPRLVGGVVLDAEGEPRGDCPAPGRGRAIARADKSGDNQHHSQ